MERWKLCLSSLLKKKKKPGKKQYLEKSSSSVYTIYLEPISHFTSGKCRLCSLFLCTMTACYFAPLSIAAVTLTDALNMLLQTYICLSHSGTVL